MKYEKEFKVFQDKLWSILKMDEDRHINELYGLIMEVREFIRNSDIKHPNFKGVQKSYLDLFTKNAEIIEATESLSKSKQASKFTDCFTNMSADLREIATAYERIQRG